VEGRMVLDRAKRRLIRVESDRERTTERLRR
jgi:hypothetical protein